MERKTEKEREPGVVAYTYNPGTQRLRLEELQFKARLRGPAQNEKSVSTFSRIRRLASSWGTYTKAWGLADQKSLGLFKFIFFFGREKECIEDVAYKAGPREDSCEVCPKSENG